jgi:cytochrome b6-f complex iron-sulfur subunit
MADDDQGDTPAPARRDFLGLAVTTTAAAFGILAAYPALRFLEPAEQVTPGVATAGKAAEFPRGAGRIVLLGSVPVLVLRMDDGSFRAFEALCTHLQCVVSYSRAHKQIECHCHDGVYSLDGKNVSGPPPRPLKKVAVSVVNGVITLSEA